ncbi:MAG: outer membrane lipoprotein-sorting protein [Candidatus Omnitrophota bacterium]
MHKIIPLLTLFFSLIAGISEAQMSADEIAARASRMAYYQGKDGNSRVNMVITDAQGRQRERQMAILRFNIADNGDQKYYVYFYKPSDVKGMSYIVWKHPDKDDDRWLYLPALDLVRRVASSDKRSSFAGTNFLYEDISGRSVGLDKHELLSEEGDSYLVKNTPKDADQVEFSYYQVRIDKKDFIPLKAEYYNKEGRPYRTVEALEVKNIQGYPTIVKMAASDLDSGSSTTADFSDVSYGVGLNENIFTERYLRNPPAKWIKE